MRDLTGAEHAAADALGHVIEHEPVLRPVLVQDYAQARKAQRGLSRRLDAFCDVLVQRNEPQFTTPGMDPPGGPSSDFDGAIA